MLENWIVMQKWKELFTTSKIIADKLEVNHNTFLRTVERVIDLYDLSEESSIHPCIVKYPEKIIKTTFINKQKAEYKWYFINEPAFMLIMMNSSSYSKARKIQQEIVQAFFHMKETLQNQSNASWIEKRNEWKKVRELEMDIVKEFVEYATAQWSKNAKMYYANITKMTNKALELLISVKDSKPIRDLATLEQLWMIMLADDRAKKAIEDWMKRKLPYKEVYIYAKDEVNKLTDAMNFKPKLS